MNWITVGMPDLRRGDELGARPCWCCWPVGKEFGRRRSWFVRPTSARMRGRSVFLAAGSSRESRRKPAAFREAAEEIGIEADEVEVLGRLSPVYIYASNNEMLPCLAVARRVPFQPNPAEVAQVCWLPISALFADRRGVHEIRRWGSSFYTPHLCWENETYLGRDETRARGTRRTLSAVRPWRRIRRQYIEPPPIETLALVRLAGSLQGLVVPSKKSSGAVDPFP